MSDDTPDMRLDLSIGMRDRSDTTANQFIGAGVRVRF